MLTVPPERLSVTSIPAIYEQFSHRKQEFSVKVKEFSAFNEILWHTICLLLDRKRS